MRTITKELYKFDELNEQAKETAICNFRINYEYPWNVENIHTLNTFADMFGVDIFNWEYGYRNYINYDFAVDEAIDNLTDVRLMKWILNNYGDKLFKQKYLTHINDKPVYSKIQKENSCVLTGYWIDFDILASIYAFLLKPNNCTTISDLIGYCLNNWISACQKDFDNYFSDDYIIETIENTNYEFYNDGELY